MWNIEVVSDPFSSGVLFLGGPTLFFLSGPFSLILFVVLGTSLFSVFRPACGLYFFSFTGTPKMSVLSAFFFAFTSFLRVVPLYFRRNWVGVLFFLSTTFMAV